MEVEQDGESFGKPSIANSGDEFAKPLTLRSLASFRSLIITSSTSEVEISSVAKTLTGSLLLPANHLVRHQILKVLLDLASSHGRLSRIVFDSVHSYLLLSADSTRLAADSLWILASIVERSPELVSTMYEFDERLLVSLCFGPSVSARTWLLKNAEKFRIGPYLLFSVFFGFTKDPYPYVREAALDGLTGLSKSTLFEDHGVIKGCYTRTVELLMDMEDCVRSAAVRTVTAWGLMLVASGSEDKQYWSDDIFVKLSFMTRDMCVEVRVEAFKAMEKIELVSGDILLQSISKRVLDISKRKKSLGQFPTEVSAANTAGAFVHGVEDEYSEVRQSACHSIRKLTILSTEFASEALNMLMDILNDDSLFVRLEALETMYYMASTDCLKLQEAHMHMFLGTVVDRNARVRFVVRKIIEIVRLPDFELFKLSVNGIIESLELYPEDETAIFFTLFHIGKNHGEFAICFIEEVSQKIEPFSEGFDRLSVAAMLVLAISTPLARDQVSSIPPRIFSYAVTLLGRISHALANVMDQNNLFTYLLQRSRAAEFSDSEFKLNEGNACQIYPSTCTSGATDSSEETMLGQNRQSAYKLLSHTMIEPRDLQASTSVNQLIIEVTESLNNILKHTRHIWMLIQTGMTNESLTILRFCKESLSLFTASPIEHGASGNLAFTFLYLKVVKLLAKVWGHFLPAIRPKVRESGVMLGKLDRRLRELKSRFLGFSADQELHILELVLLTCILRLSKGEICCHGIAFRKLSSIASQIDSILQNRGGEPSIFVIEVGKELSSPTDDEGFRSPSTFRKLLKFFTLNHFTFHGRLNHIKAELFILDNDSNHPLHFVPGLPVGIPCKIVLYSISSEKRLWVQINTNNETSQLLFLDLGQIGGSEEFKEFTYTAPFYRTPKATSFTTKVCIGLECPFEDPCPGRRYGGPSRQLTYICEEKEVYFSLAPKD